VVNRPSRLEAQNPRRAGGNRLAAVHGSCGVLAARHAAMFEKKFFLVAFGVASL